MFRIVSIAIILLVVVVATASAKPNGNVIRLSNELDNSAEEGLSKRFKDTQCATGKYPPGSDKNVPKYVINLDLPPEERWNHVSADLKSELKDLIGVVKNLTSYLFGGKVIKFVDRTFPALLTTLPEPYQSEMRGISNATGVPVGEVVLYNIFYELFTVCTSIVAESPNGNLIHGRNLDFGLFLGWDVKNHTWRTSEALRPTVIQLDFQRNNTTIYRSASFFGYVGMLTAMKPKSFTLTIDERFQVNGGFMGVIQWLLGDRSTSWLGFLMRDVMEQADSYDEAQKILYEAKLLAPAYFILAGNESGQACVMTKDRDSPKADVWTMEDSGYGWFILETNYDHWKKAPFFDDRRTSAVTCMNKLTKTNADFNGLFNVLSTQPNLNKLTTYTALMDTNEDKIEVYLQNCEDYHCPPF